VRVGRFPRANGQALTPEWRKLRNGFGIPVKNEYRRIEYTTERIEGVRIARLRKTERGEGRLHPRGAIAQQIEILHRASSVADLHFDTIACKYSSILPGEAIIPGPCHPGSDYKVTWGIGSMKR
jgi:hypothetical protein